MTRIRIGAIGVGIAFRELHLPELARYGGEVELTAVCGTRPETSERARELVQERTGASPTVFTNPTQLIDSGLVDCILLCVPIRETHRLALQVLASKLDLVVEKPLGQTASEGLEIIQAAESVGRLLAVCENFRYQPGFRQVKDLVGSGIIGDPRLYYLNDLHYTPPDGMYSVTPWRQRSDHSGGYILDGGSHIVAGLRVMVDATPTEVHAVPTSFHPGHLGAPWDTALVNLRFDNGIVGHLALGYGSPDREARHPKILGTEGTIALKKDRIEIWRSDATKDETLELVGRSSGIPDEWDDFVPALRRNSALKYPALEAVRDLAVIDGILASARSGAVVPVERY